jgi:hypothetical protein
MKKERRERLSSRRRRTLRRVLIALAAVFVVNRVFMIGLLFPIQAIRHNEERQGTGRTAVVCRDWEPNFRWNFLAYLTGNENVTMFSGADLELYGWSQSPGPALDCSEEAPMHCGLWTIRAGNRMRLYVFGRIDDPDIVRLKIQGSWTTFKDDSDLPTSQTEQEWALEEGDWLEKDGRRYFLAATRAGAEVSWSVQDFTVIGYDKYYYETARAEVKQGASSTFYD